MSYTVITEDLGSFSKFVLSFWFRVPQASIDKCAAIINTSVVSELPLQGCLPLVVFGKRGRKDATTKFDPYSITYHTNGYFILGLGDEQVITYTIGGPFIFHVTVTTRVNPNAYYGPNDIENTVTYSDFLVPDQPVGKGDETSPSFIGIDCSAIGNPSLVINIESAQTPVITGVKFQARAEVATETVPSHTEDDVFFDFKQGTIVGTYDTNTISGLVFGSEVQVSNDVHIVPSPEVTIEFQQYGALEDMSMLGRDETGAIFAEGPAILADHWHHVLLSVDFKTVATHGVTFDDFGSGHHDQLKDHVTSAAQMFLAVDDKNYKASEFAEYPTGGGDNDVITSSADDIANDIEQIDADNNRLGTPLYTLSNPQITVGANSFGVPATAAYVDTILTVEMHKMMLFTGVAVDTSLEAIRRLFITEKDQTTGIQKPASKKLATDVFGDPDVDFTSLSKWRSTKENGPSFATGQIDAYTPTPNLGGKQGETGRYS